MHKTSRLKHAWTSAGGAFQIRWQNQMQQINTKKKRLIFAQQDKKDDGKTCKAKPSTPHFRERRRGEHTRTKIEGVIYLSQEPSFGSGCVRVCQFSVWYGVMLLSWITVTTLSHRRARERLLSIMILPSCFASLWKQIHTHTRARGTATSGWATLHMLWREGKRVCMAFHSIINRGVWWWWIVAEEEVGGSSAF